jgi:sigma-B regulation protein RsbU (phosphoserine phosphatase)
MVETRAVLRALATTYGDVGHMLTLANNLMLPHGRFVSLFLARLDPVSGSLSYACGGHPSLVLRKNGTVKDLRSETPPLGIVTGATYKTWITDPLEPGDILVLYTDGINETQSLDGSLFGTERLVDSITKNRHSPAKQIIAEVFSDVGEFSDGRPPSDDRTLVVAKVM